MSRRGTELFLFAGFSNGFKGNRETAQHRRGCASATASSLASRSDPTQHTTFWAIGSQTRDVIDPPRSPEGGQFPDPNRPGFWRTPGISHKQQQTGIVKDERETRRDKRGKQRGLVRPKGAKENCLLTVGRHWKPREKRGISPRPPLRDPGGPLRSNHD